MPDTERDSLLKTSKKGKGDKLTTFVTPAKSKKAEDKNTLTNESKPKNDNSKVMKVWSSLNPIMASLLHVHSQLYHLTVKVTVTVPRVEQKSL